MVDENTTSIADGLRELLRCDPDQVTVGELIGRVETAGGGLAPVVFVLSLPMMLPLPPGATTLTALPLLIVAPQMIAGGARLWLPRRVAAHVIRRDSLHRILGAMLPWLDRAERLVRPRLTFLGGRLGAMLVGLICTLLGVVLVLPIPFGNMLPGLTSALLALGLARRDGLVMMLGFALLAASVAAIGLGLQGVRLGLGRLADFL